MNVKGTPTMPYFERLHLYYFSVCLISLLLSTGSCKKISMRIVNEPSNYGVNNYQQQSVEETLMKMRIVPSNFSGPPHLRVLLGKCFSRIDNEYKYEFCPFSNVTQQEQSLRWNPYSGVLGVWQEWEIINNTFTAMMMLEGDTCGDIYRSVKVLFKCGAKDEIESVKEPETCHYELVFVTPYTCHPHAMLVYPTLLAPLRHQWDELESRWLSEEITLQGYNKFLRHIFEAAGLQVPQSRKDQIAEELKKKEEKVKEKETKDEAQFESLDVCRQEYANLKEELEGVRALLQVYKKDNDTQEDYPYRRYQHYDERGEADYAYADQGK